MRDLDVPREYSQAASDIGVDLSVLMSLIANAPDLLSLRTALFLKANGEEQKDRIKKLGTLDYEIIKELMPARSGKKS